MRRSRRLLLAAGGVAAIIAAAAGIALVNRNDDAQPSGSDDTQVLGIQVTPPPAVPTLPPDVSRPVQDPPRVPPVVTNPESRTTTTTTTTTITTVTPAPITPRNVTRPNPINCLNEAHRQFCTAQESMNVSGGSVGARTSSTQTKPENTPTFTLTSEPLRSDGQPAKPGDKVTTLRVRLELVNETSRNFIVPEGDLAVKMKRNGQDVSLPVQKQGQFEMRPGAKLEANYQIPIIEDGSYSWYGETFFYEA